MDIEIDNPTYCGDFIRLNEAWITEYFELEEADLRLAADPFRIVRDGGHIVSLSQSGAVIGVCALIKASPDRFQLSKFTVAAGHRCKGYGDALLRTALQLATQDGAESVFLYSHTKLRPAISLYRKHGFKTVAVGPHPSYARTNIVMEWRSPLVAWRGEETDDQVCLA